MKIEKKLKKEQKTNCVCTKTSIYLGFEPNTSIYLQVSIVKFTARARGLHTGV